MARRGGGKQARDFRVSPQGRKGEQSRVRKSSTEAARESLAVALETLSGFTAHRTNGDLLNLLLAGNDVANWNAFEFEPSAQTATFLKHPEGSRFAAIRTPRSFPWKKCAAFRTNPLAITSHPEPTLS